VLSGGVTAREPNGVAEKAANAEARPTLPRCPGGPAKVTVLMDAPARKAAAARGRGWKSMEEVWAACPRAPSRRKRHRSSECRASDVQKVAKEYRKPGGRWRRARTG
jgi:hypothetical protein